MVTRTLVAQAQSSKPRGRWWFGYEVFDVDGDFRLVIHTTTYDGIRVDSHHATPEQALESLTRDEAIQEAARRTAAYANTVIGPVS